jgi:hypothetical protein
MARVVECLPSKGKVLTSNPSTAEEKTLYGKTLVFKECLLLGISEVQLVCLLVVLERCLKADGDSAFQFPDVSVHFGAFILKQILSE